MIIIIIPNEPNPNMTGRHYGIAKGLAAQGHDVHTVMWQLPQLQSGFGRITHLWRSLRRSQNTYEDLTLHQIGRLPYFWPYINGWLFKWQLRKLFKKLDADLIFTMSYTNETEVPMDLPYIYDLADDYAAPADVFGSLPYKIMFAVLGVKRTMRRQCQHALAVTAVSNILCEYARQYNSRVVKLPNGVETNILASIKSVQSRPHSLIYVSGFGAWSQPIPVMKAVTRLRHDFPDISLTLVGEGSEVAAIKEHIAQNALEDYIDYRGFIHDRRSVFTLIAEHEIGLNVSEKNRWRDAAHPMKVIEYSALGKKVVSTDLTGVTELGYPNLYLFAGNGPDSGLDKALRSALLAKKPRDNYEKLRRAVLEEYGWSHILFELTQLFEDVLTQRTAHCIVHVTPAYPPHLGGLEKVVQVLAGAESKLGCDVSVITSDKGVGNRNIITDNIPIQRLRSFVVANTTIMMGLPFVLLRLRRHAFVHLHVTQAFTPEMVWLASRFKRFHYIAHIHLDVPPSGAAGFLLGIYKSLFLRRVLRAASMVVVFTNDQKHEVHTRYHIPLKSIRVIPNGVEDAFYFNKARRVHERPRLLFVGRLGYQKNIPLLLHALEGISEKFDTTLVGDGELRSALETQTQEMQLQHIQFVGRADGEQLINHYRNADIFVLPSEREGMPLVLLEAMAMGLPIVATDVTGSRDVVVNDRNGILIPLDDAAAFRAALLSLRDKRLYARLHYEARQMADAYSWYKIARRFTDLYEEVA